MWKHRSGPSNGAAEALRGADCDAGPHSEKVLWRDKRECGSRNVRETPFNTPGRQENSQESGWKTERGKPGQRCVLLYKMSHCPGQERLLFFWPLRGIWKELNLYSDRTLKINQYFKWLKSVATRAPRGVCEYSQLSLLILTILSSLSIFPPLLLWREIEQRVCKKIKSSV